VPEPAEAVIEPLDIVNDADEDGDMDAALDLLSDLVLLEHPERAVARTAAPPTVIMKARIMVFSFVCAGD
jgi:hypothetical protein